MLWGQYRAYFGLLDALELEKVCALGGVRSVGLWSRLGSIFYSSCQVLESALCGCKRLWELLSAGIFRAAAGFVGLPFHDLVKDFHGAVQGCWKGVALRFGRPDAIFHCFFGNA